MTLELGHWCKIGAHASCSGSWQGAACECDCHGTVHLDHSDIDLTISDRQQVRAFVAFLRHAHKAGTRLVRLHPAWHAWITGAGPTPDPETEVGPERKP